MTTTETRSVGKPMPCAAVLIIDQFGNLGPTFVRGEICIGGVQLFSGYQSQEDLTNRAHFDHSRYGRLYRTGDLGFYDASGNIIFCGRRDKQTKVNGQRFEPESISSILCEMAQVDRCAVAVFNGKIVAFVVYTSWYAPPMDSVLCKVEDMDELRNYVRCRITSTFMPSIWLRLSHLPLTVSGKIDTHQLCELVEALPPYPEAVFDVPQDLVEQKVCECCVEVLGKPMGMMENLFNHGLDSYLAMVLISRLTLVFPACRILFHHLMANPVPRALAALARGEPLPTEKSSLSAAKARTDSHQYYPTSSMQARFCLAQEVFSDSSYSIPSFFEGPSIDPDRLRAGVNEIVKEHAVFRTLFGFDPITGYQQVVAANLDVQTEVYDFTSDDTSTALSPIREVLRSDMETPFDTSLLPLMRCKVFRKSCQKIVLYLNFHHTIMDEQSVRTFAADLANRLWTTQPLSSFWTATCPQNSRQYIEYSAEEEQRLKDSSLIEGSLHFWQRHLEGMEGPILSPHTSDEHLGVLSKHATITSSLFGWARSHGLTSFSVCLALFYTLLARCWGCFNTVVLIPITQRSTGYEFSYGCFLNTVPMHFPLDSSALLADTIRNVHRRLIDVIEHSYLPFEKILEAANLTTEEFPIMFVYHEKLDHGERPILEDQSHMFRDLANDKVTPKFPITFSLTVTKGKAEWDIQIDIDYDPQRMSAAAVESLLEHYPLLMSLLPADTSLALGDLDILTKTEKELLKQQRRVGPVLKEASPRVHDLIERRSRETPEHIACWFEADIKTTYAQLWNMVRQCSRILVTCNAHTGNRLAIYMPPGVERVVAIVSALRAGFAYVPLDIEWPALRLAAILRDCEPAFVLVSSTSTLERHSALHTALAQCGSKNVLISMHGEPVSNEHEQEEVQMPTIEASDLAYILYTSGSTGTPKGVQIEHGALSSSLAEHCRIYGLMETSRLLQLAPWTFDVSVVDILGTLSNGATLCMGSKDYLLSGLQGAINAMAVTHLATTPTIAALLLPEKCRTLELLAVGGEPMTRTVHASWCRALRLLNVYGPTEAAVNVIYHHVQPYSDVGIIGDPLRGVTIRILDDRLQEVLSGNTGQLAIGGVQLARGYTNKILDEKAFVEHPTFGRLFLSGQYTYLPQLPAPCGVLLTRSGDIARFLHDGSIQCLGRKDHQIKLRGQRLEPEEVEAVLNADSEIMSPLVCLVKTGRVEALCATFSTKSLPAESHTVIEILDHNEQTRTISLRLEAYAKVHLPSYAVPRYWIPLTSPPLDQNSKLNRGLVRKLVSSLPERDILQYSVSGGHLKGLGTPLQSRIEKLLGKCFAEIFGIANLFKENNFFALSGDSISAIRLCSLARYHGLRLRVSDIYQNPTLEKLASVVRRVDTTVSTLPTPASTGMVLHTPVMAWFFDLQKRNRNWYHQTFAIELKDTQDLEKIPSAWKAILEIHPMLRIRIPTAGTRVEIMDSSEHGHFAIHRATYESLDELHNGVIDVASSIHLGSGPTSSLGLFNVAGHCYCVICVHHLAIDIVSWQIVSDDLGRLLRGKSPLPEYASFQDWSLHLQHQSGVTEKSFSIIDDGSDTAPVNVDLFSNYAESAHLNTVGRAQVTNRKVSDMSTTFLLADIPQRSEFEVVDILLAALVLAFYRWKHVQQAQVTLESHGRDLSDGALDVSRTVGWFTSMTKMMLLLPQPSPRLLHELIAGVQKNRRLATNEISLWTPFMKDGPRTPVITFNYRGAYSNNLENDVFNPIDISGSQADEDPLNERFAALDIGCGIEDGVLMLDAIYSNCLHEEGEVDELVVMWSKTLQEIFSHLAHHHARDVITSHKFSSLQLNDRQIQDLIFPTLTDAGIEHAEIQNVSRATDMQKSMILTSLELLTYIESITYRIEGAVEPDSFFAAWSAVVTKHDALRSVFVLCDPKNKEVRGEILQVILLPGPRTSTLSLADCDPTPLTFGYGKATSQAHLRWTAGGYQLSWKYHHALLDGWSSGIILRDFQAAYVGKPMCAPVSFEKFRKRIAKCWQDDAVRKFWKSQLHEVLPNHLVDYSHPAGSAQSEQHLLDWCHDYPLVCSVAQISTCAAANTMTAASILRAAWAVALAHFYGAEEVVFGVTTSGRNIDIDGVEEIVGLCINTIPFCIGVDNSASREVYLRKARSVSAALVENENLSLHRIYQATGTSDLFDTTLVYQNYAKFPPREDLPFTMKTMEAEERTEIPLNVMISPTASGKLHVSALVHGRHISSRYLNDLLTALDLALAWLCDSDVGEARTIGQLDLLSAAAHQQLSVFSRGPELHLPDPSVWHCFVSQATSFPRATALEFFYGGNVGAMSYQELREKTENAAQYFYARDVRMGDRVALYLDKSPAMIFVMLALLKLGAVCVPLRFGSSAERLRDLVQDTTIKLAVLSEKSASVFPVSTNLAYVEIILERQVLEAFQQALAPGHDDAAIILFTSGTTGKPKGVVMPYRQVTAYAINMARAYRYDRHSRILSFASYAFDVFISDMFGGLLAGATVCLAEEKEVMDDLAGYLNISRCTHVNLTPSVASLLTLADLPYLKSLVLTGEPATRMILQKWAPVVHTVNSYGEYPTYLLLYVTVVREHF